MTGRAGIPRDDGLQTTFSFVRNGGACTRGRTVVEVDGRLDEVNMAANVLGDGIGLATYDEMTGMNEQEV